MVEILLATYNGSKYIKTQIDSLLNQTYKHIKILIRDDGSTDGTQNIIKKYAEKYPNKIQIIQDSKKCGSSVSNFMQLIKYAISDYIMFCDQDDYWFPKKVELTLKKMKEIEKNKSIPILVFSDYQCVNADLKLLKKDIKKSQIYKMKIDLPHLLVQNYVTGCCMMVNKSLYENMLITSDAILMHDWWIAIYATSFGKIYHIKKPLMYYRQHNEQFVGAVDVKSLNYVLQKLKNNSSKNYMKKYFNQAKYFLKLYGYKLNLKNKKVFLNFISIEKKSKLSRIILLIKRRHLKNDFIRILGQLIYI